MIKLNNTFGWISSIVITAVVILLCISKISSCTREKPITKLDNHRVKILDVDSLERVIEAKVRAVAGDSIQALKDSLELHKAVIKQAESQAVIEVVKYIKVPTLANGKAALAAKDKVIEEVKKESETKDNIITQQAVQIGSYQRDSLQSRITISELNKGYQAALKLAKTRGKPKRFGLGVSAGYGVAAKDLSNPIPIVGFTLNYNLVRF